MEHFPEITPFAFFYYIKGDPGHIVMCIDNVYNVRPLLYRLFFLEIVAAFFLSKWLVGFVLENCVVNNVRSDCRVIFEGNSLVYGVMALKLDC